MTGYVGRHRRPARDPLEDLIDWTRTGMARLGLDQPFEAWWGCEICTFTYFGIRPDDGICDDCR